MKSSTPVMDVHSMSKSSGSRYTFSPPQSRVESEGNVFVALNGRGRGRDDHATRRHNLDAVDATALELRLAHPQHDLHAVPLVGLQRADNFFNRVRLRFVEH